MGRALALFHLPEAFENYGLVGPPRRSNAAAETIDSMWILVKLGAVATEDLARRVVGWIALQAHARRSLSAWCLDLVGDLTDADMVGRLGGPFIKIKYRCGLWHTLLARNSRRPGGF